MASTDIVIVTYNSESRIVACLESFSNQPAVNVIVVDNASSDRTLEAAGRFPVTILPQRANRGFAAGCNAGWRSGGAEYVLFLNPDAVIDSASLSLLTAVLERDPMVGIVAPKFVYNDGRLAPYLRRFPRLTSTYGQALLLHRAFPRACLMSELVTDDAVYRAPGVHDWVPGACLLVRRSLLELTGGFDEQFFMYCEDKDLCKRARDAGFLVWYEPGALCVHEGAASAPRATLLPVLAESRIRYVQKHCGRLAVMLHRAGLMLEALIRLAVTHGGRRQRVGHARALGRLLRMRRRPVVAVRGGGPA